ncbi:Uncharacterized protein Fot_56609 [Forsythia ovata]|uniref:Uncharacterized protein n=1 Tax=Forsythia ovata TaxID=205694 RepID=A0ABD1NZQ5_9LAMI
MGQLLMGLSNSLTPDFDEQLVRKRHHIYWRNFNLAYDVPLEPTTQLALLRKDAYGPSKYIAMLQATKDIFREEGLQYVEKIVQNHLIAQQLWDIVRANDKKALIQTVGSFIGGGSTIVALVHDGYGLQKDSSLLQEPKDTKVSRKMVIFCA